MNDPRSLLATTLSERITVNPQYSLRAFARDLEISPQQLSNILNGRRGVSQRIAKKISQKLGMAGDDQELFVQSAKAKFGRTLSERNAAQVKVETLLSGNPSRGIELDLFKVVSTWYHFALIELVKIPCTEKNKIEWYAAKLGISENEVTASLGRLERVGVIEKTSQGWSACQGFLIADYAVPSEAVKSFHQQMIQRSLQALAFQTSEERYGSSSTMPMAVKNVARAKKMIQDFRFNFSKELTSVKKGNEIFGLNIQLFKLTQDERKKPK